MIQQSLLSVWFLSNYENIIGYVKISTTYMEKKLLKCEWKALNHKAYQKEEKVAKRYNAT